MSLRIARCALALGCLATTASPHEIKVLLRVGDQVPGAGKITAIESIEVHSVGGGWLALVHTDDPVAHSVLLVSGMPYFMTGTLLDYPWGASLSTLDSPTGGYSLMYIARLGGGTPVQAAVSGYEAQLMTGESATTFTNQLPSGSMWRRFDDVHSSSQWDDGFLVRGSIDDPVAGASDRSFACVGWTPSQGHVSWIEVLALEGQAAPGIARNIESVRGALGQGCMGRDADDAAWSCDLDGPATDDGCVYLTKLGYETGSRLIAREGTPSPVAGRTWGALEDLALDLDSHGSWTLRTQLDGSDPASDEVLVRDAQVVAREGDVLAATAPYPLTSLGQGRGVLDDHRHVLWFGAWDDPSTPVADEALFVDGDAELRTGETSVAGSVLTDLEAGVRSYSFEPEYSRFIAFMGTLADGTKGAFLLDRSDVEVYCTAKTNSLGVVPVITPSTWGKPSATLGHFFKISATFLTKNSLSVFFYGTDGPLALPFHGGTLCVQPPLQRGVLMSTRGGMGTYGQASMDFNKWIASGVDPRLVAGARVFVQLWYRDSGFPPPDDVGLTAGVQFRIEP
jgi:hypothetical protein